MIRDTERKPNSPYGQHQPRKPNRFSGWVLHEQMSESGEYERYRSFSKRKSFIFKQKIRFKRIGYGNRLSLLFIII